MPKVVDHDARRREVTAVAAELIATEGRSALTVRNVATRAGYSTKVVSHYFADIGDLLHETYDYAAGRARARIKTVLDRDPADIRGLIEAVLPLDAVRRDDWRIWFAFWSEALASPALAKDQRRRARAETKRIVTCLQRMRDDGALPTGVDIERAADRLSALVPGIAAEAVFDPSRWTATRQRRVLTDALVSLGIRLD
ncbi:TetR/AcrR family transcriptional regulator [Ilumatobacter coccineus]|uniref:Putative TetR family transcriptional regulator n=1 Tax=Ilumatobacter coccineus (strain NBRC 103263 / KCTC 29153 / YM16-304) TaxID=1313172 RepID=A0A6C7E869_ILUCY|nr:TetR/AcrR family transcriptional regulator [Ilumatobacter coccineus]BAN00788.1 putative TetR family transcriptional regulator [Ilumatobacter coccineus YM16-304]